MASFASSPTTFTPYIPQFNTQLYASVGMQKQQAYSEGLSKILGYRESVAGLAVARDVDKAYLNNKVQELNTQLQTLVGGDADFSKMQVVNSTGGLISQVANDKVVQNAVISAQNYADASAQIKQAHKDGKSAITNDHAIMRNIQAWQQGGLEDTLGKQQYTNFFDYQKGFQDFMKDKHGNVIVEQSPIGGNGWSAYALVEGKKVALDPLSVKQDAQTYFLSNPQAQGQLDIDTQYYADMTPDNVVLSQYREMGNRELMRIDTQLKDLQTEIKLYPSKSAELQGKIRQYEQARTKQIMNNESLEQKFMADPYAAKATMFQQDVMNGFANRYAYEDIESKIVKNPYRDAMMDEAQLNLQQQKFAWEQETWNKKFDQDERKMANDIKAAKIASGSLIGGGQYDAAYAEAYTPEQYIEDVKLENEQVGQQQLALMYKIDPTNIILGEDAQGNPLYRTRPGYTQAQRQSDWNKISASYYDNPQASNSDVARYFGAQFSEDYGIGKEKVVQAKIQEINNIESSIGNRFKNDPNYENYQKSLSGLGSQNQILLNEGGVQISRGDLIKYAQATKNQGNAGRNTNEIAQASGLSPSKVEIIARRATGQLQGFGDIGKAIISAGFYDPADVRSGGIGEEYKKIQKIVSQTDKTFEQFRKNAFQGAIANKPTVRITEKLTDKNPQGIALLKGKLDTSDPEGAERINEVLAQKGDAFMTIQKNSTNGNFTAIVSKGGLTETFDLTSIEAAQMAPQLVIPNKYSGQEALIRANSKGRRGVPSSTGRNGFTSYTPERTNLQNVQLRYQIDYDGAEGYKPNIEYKISNTDEWIPLPIDPRYTDLDQANRIVEELALRDDNYFYNTFLKQ